MTQEAFNAIYDRCNDPNRGKLRGKFLFQDFVSFMNELNSFSLPDPDEVGPFDFPAQKINQNKILSMKFVERRV